MMKPRREPLSRPVGLACDPFKSAKFWIVIFAATMALVLFKVNFVQAANNNVGTSAAPFLKIGAGARPTAMGDAFVGLADDVNAVAFNPAGLAQIKRPELTAMHTQWFQGMDYDFGAVAIPLSKGTFGFSAATLKADGLERRNTEEAYLGGFEAMDSAYAASYGFNLRERTALGVTGRYIRQKIDTASAAGWAGDVGVLHRLHDRWSAGLAIRHMGPGLKFNNERDPLPLTIEGGLGGRFMNDKLILGFSLQKPRDNDVTFGLGGELRQNMGPDFRSALRGGYNSARTDAGGTNGLSMGAGLGYRQFELDFAWVPFGDLGNTFRYAVLFRFE